jgi:hypothetical protein
MSALDYGAGNTTRYYSFTGPALGTGAWCALAWFRATRMDSTGSQGIFSWNNSGANNSGYIYLFQAGGANRWGANVKNDSGTDLISTSQGTALTSDGLDRLVVMQYTTTHVQVWVVQEGASAGSPYQVATTAGNNSSATWRIGGIGSLSFECENPLGEFGLLVGDTLTEAQVTELATGKQITAVKPGASWHLPFRSGAVANETNLGSAGGSAARTGTGYAEVADFFALTQSPYYPLETTLYV